MVQPPLTHAADLPRVDHHADAHGNIEHVAAVLQLLTHALPFPGVPVRHVRERGFAVQGLQCAKLCQAIFLAAMMAHERRALALHFPLGEAVRTLVEHAVEPVGAEGLADRDAIFLPPAEAVERELRGNARVDRVDRFPRELRRGEQVFELGRDVDPALLQPVVERVARERTVGVQHHDRHAQCLDALADALGQGRGRAVEAVARLGIEQNRRFELAHAVEHIAHEGCVRAELARGDTADAAHQRLLADEAVRRADDVERTRIEHRFGDLEIEKAGVIHQNEAGLVIRKPLHAVLFTVKMCGMKVRRGRRAQKAAQCQ